ncbi:unnamed protein product [Effrenium voratum]|nr:unnamed protein product [Effrenium voratum]
MVLRRPSSRQGVGGVELVPSSAWESARRRLKQPVAKGHWPGLCACVFVGGRLRMVEELGFADIEAKTPMTRKTLMRVYSMSKCIVAAAVMQLIEAGRISLDDELSKHIPAFADVKVVMEGPDGLPDFNRLVPSRRPIRIRHLLTHTSGISCGLAPELDGPKQRTARERAWAGIYTALVDRVDRGDAKDLADWVADLAKLPLQSHPGTSYAYGYSYDILGHLVELTSGKKLGRYLQDHVFKPLGMRDTGFELQTSSRRLGVLYRRTKSRLWGSNGRSFRLVRVDPVKGKRSRWAKVCKVPSAGGGLSSLEGGLLSTMDDYAKFLLMVTSGGTHPAGGQRILGKQSADFMMSDFCELLRVNGRLPSCARPYDDPGLGLSGLGELLRQPCIYLGLWLVSEVRRRAGSAAMGRCSKLRV